MPSWRRLASFQLGEFLGDRGRYLKRIAVRCFLRKKKKRNEEFVLFKSFFPVLTRGVFWKESGIPPPKNGLSLFMLFVVN